MIKLKNILKEIDEQKRDVKYLQYRTGDPTKDDESNSLEWDVEYGANLKTINEMFLDVEKYLLNAAKIEKDKEFGKLAEDVKYVMGRFQAHLRNKYPGTLR